MFHASSKRVEFSAFHNERLYMLEFGYLERLDHHSALRRPGGNFKRLIVCLYLYYSLHNIRNYGIDEYHAARVDSESDAILVVEYSNRTLSLGDFVPFADAGTNQAWL